MVELTDINETHGNQPFRRFFFTSEGKFLVGRAEKKPYYEYKGFTKRGKKMWRKHYTVDLAEGEVVILYAIRGRWRGWQEMVCTNGRLETQEQHEGVAPWMVKQCIDKPPEGVVE